MLHIVFEYKNMNSKIRFSGKDVFGLLLLWPTAHLDEHYCRYTQYKNQNDQRAATGTQDH